MIERIIDNKWLVLVVLVYDIYNVMLLLMGAEMDIAGIDWFGLGIKVFMCLVIVALLRHVQRLQDMLQVHRAVSLYRNRNLLLGAVDADADDERAIVSHAMQVEKSAVRRYLKDKFPDKKGKDIDELLERYYLGK